MTERPYLPSESTTSLVAHISSLESRVSQTERLCKRYRAVLIVMGLIVALNAIATVLVLLELSRNARW